MIWFICEDNSLYNDITLEHLKQKYNLSKIKKFPDKKDILDNINNTKTGFIAPYYPEKIIDLEKNSSFFLTVKIKNSYEPYTKEEHLYGDKKDILSKKLGLKIHKSSLKIKDYVGADALVNEFKKIELLKSAGFEAKGFLIVGLPGTGKSFFAKCIAGETERLLIELNFAKIMESERPLEKIDTIFYFLENINDKLIVWIDEIEKMFKNPASAEIMGRFLTLINDFNSRGDVLFIATANNIVELSKKNPELFRTGGRFDKIIALLPPTNDNAEKIFEHYLNKYTEKFLNETCISSLFCLIKKENFKYKHTNFELFLNDFFIKMTDEFEGYYKILKECDNLTLFKKEFKKILNSSEIFKKKFEQTILNIFFDLKELKKSFLLETLTKYRAMCVVQERFPYTPAEISSVAKEFFINYFLNPSFLGKNYENILTYTLISVIPLQAQMKEQIAEMYSQAENFLKV